MRNLESINADITKTKARIAEQSAQLRDLERQKIEAENAEIVRVIRNWNISDREIYALTQRFRQAKPTDAKSTKDVSNQTKGETNI